MPYNVGQVKALPAPTVKKLLREAGYNLRHVADLGGVSQALVSLVVRKHTKSEKVWTIVTALINHPRAIEPHNAPAPLLRDVELAGFV